MNPVICTWCENKSKEVCFACAQEGKYRYLEPARLADWELPPELPNMSELVDLPAPERLALIWLNAKYLDMKEIAGDI